MATPTIVRGRDTLTLALGASWLLFALWDMSDETFGSSSGGALGAASAGLFHLFGHWGPRIALIALGLLCVALSFWFAARAREHAWADEPGGTRAGAVLSWTPILLVLSLLAFIALGPLLRNPEIDGVLSYWREHYYTPATMLTTLCVVGLALRVSWKEFREVGDPLALPRMLMYLVIAALMVLALLWEPIFGAG